MKKKLFFILITILCIGCGSQKQLQEENAATEIENKTVPIIYKKSTWKERERAYVSKKSVYQKNGVKFYVYEPSSENVCWVTQIEIMDKEVTEKLIIPDSFNHKPVIKIGNPSYGDAGDDIINLFGMFGEPTFIEWGTSEEKKQIKHIKEIVLPDTINEIYLGTFAGLINLEKINLPNQLVNIEERTFEACDNLKRIKIPAKVSGDLGAFILKEWERLDISSENSNWKIEEGLLLSKDGKVLYGEVLKKTKIVIPEGVEVIKKNAFFNKEAKMLYVPASVRKIGKSALDFKTKTKIIVSEKNKVYASDKNCVYTQKERGLIAATLRGRKLVVSNKVKVLKSNLSVAGSCIEKVVLPSTIKKMEIAWEPFEMESGLVKVYMKGSVPPKLENNVYGVTMNNWELHVPIELEKVYEDWLKENNESFATEKYTGADVVLCNY